jgi:hypothetical protein
MRCARVRRLLFDYIDGILDKKTSENVRSHLKVCEECARELETYRAYREKISLLRDVHAPEGFLAGVKDRIRSTKDRNIPKERIRLFFPRYKLPLEFAGALAVVLIAVVIFRHIEPEQNRPSLPVVPQTKTEKTLQPPETTGETVDELKKDKAPPPEAMDNEPALSDIRTTRHQEPSFVLKEAAPSKKEEAPAEQESGFQGAMKAPEPAASTDMEAVQASSGAVGREDRLLLSSSPETPVAVELTLFVPRPSEGVLKATAKRELMAQKAVTSEADETVSELQKEDVPLDTLENKIRSLSEELGGTVISIEYVTGRDLPRWISVQIPAGRYDDLLEGLSVLGELKTPAPAGRTEETPALVVRITIAE